jgi:formylglycine-generating enzyme required for sulfatase activity
MNWINRPEGKVEMRILKMTAVVTGLFAILFPGGCASRSVNIKSAGHAATTKAPGTIVSDCADCPSLVVIPPGSFTMTVPLAAASGPPGAAAPPVPTKDVDVAIPRAIAVGRYEVTYGQYSRFVDETRRSMPDKCFIFKDIMPNGEAVFGWVEGANWKNPGYPQTSGSPAVCISWEDAKAYVEWLSDKTGKSYRLLSETEWEYAARAGSLLEPWLKNGGTEDNACAYTNTADLSLKRKYPGLSYNANCDDGYVFTSPVGHYLPNEWGVYDMIGNAWEWVEDCSHGSYLGMPVDGSALTMGEGCGSRTRRGGSWYRAAGNNRSSLPKADWHGNAGFRVARDLDR